MGGDTKSKDKTKSAVSEADLVAAAAAAEAAELARIRESEAALAASATAAAARRKPPTDDRLVSEAELLEFLFPRAPVRLYHAASAARLFVFSRYGPLRDGALHGGRHDRRRPLSTSELELLMEEVIREDVLSAYVGDKQLAPDEQEEVLSKARHLRTKLYDYTEPEMQEFIRQLRIVEGLEAGAPLPFRKLQAAIEAERTRRALLLKRTAAPALVSAKRPSSAAGAARGTETVTALHRTRYFAPVSAPAPLERARMAGAVIVHGLGPATQIERFVAETFGDAFGEVRSASWRTDAAGRRSAAVLVELASDAASVAALRALEGAAYRGRRLHLELPLAPTPDLASFSATNLALSKHATLIAQLGLNFNDPGLRPNVQLIRTGYRSRPRPAAHDSRQWDDLHATRGTGRQSFVDDRSSRYISDFEPRPAVSLKVRDAGAR